MNKLLSCLLFLAVASVPLSAKADIVLFGGGWDYELEEKGDNLVFVFEEFGLDIFNGASGSYQFHGSDISNWAVGDSLAFGFDAVGGIDSQVALENRFSVTNAGSTTQSVNLRLSGFSSAELFLQPGNERNLDFTGFTLLANENGNIDFFNSYSYSWSGSGSYASGDINMPTDILLSFNIAAGQSISFDHSWGFLTEGDSFIAAVPEPNSFLLLGMSMSFGLVKRRRRLATA